ncbi:hypothetical protein [Lentilactobacillus hilgardii]
MIRAVIFDWAGTTIDYGNQAPAMTIKRRLSNLALRSPLRTYVKKLDWNR